MDLRVYTYGGESFAERFRAGDWDSVPVSVIEDFHGIRGGRPWFGFCVISDRPFLFWKELQNPASRGGYPFGLMLDPGEEFFDRMRWNTAWILSRLFEGEDALGRPFLLRPEDVGVTGLTRMLSQIPEPACEAFATDSGRELWTATVLENDIISVPPEVLGYSSRPTPSEIARLQESLVPGLRNGRGWIIGASRQHADYLGVRLIIDDQADVPESLPLERARKLLTSFSRLDSLDSWAITLLEPNLNKQAWRGAAEIDLVIEAIDVVRLAGDRPDDLIRFSDRLPAESDKQTWLDETCRILLSFTSPLSELATSLILKSYSTRSDPLPGSFYERASLEALHQFLSDLSIPPTPPPEVLALPPDIWLNLWKEKIRSAGTNAVVLVNKAIEQITPELTSAEENELLDIAWDATIRSDAPLSVWQAESEARPYIAQKLTDEVRKRVESGSGDRDWPEYFQFAQDNDLKWLKKNVQEKDLASLADSLATGAHPDQAIALWDWKSHGKIPLPQREKLARTNHGNWADLNQLLKILGGEHCLSPTEMKQPDRNRLLADLKDKLAHELKKDLQRSPFSLRELVELFDGKLDEVAQKQLLALKPWLKDHELAREWLEGWKLLNRDRHDQELLRWAADSLFDDGRLYFSPNLFIEPSKREVFVRATLFGILNNFRSNPGQCTPADYTRVARAALVAWRSETAFADAVQSVWKSETESERKRALNQLQDDTLLNEVLDRQQLTEIADQALIETLLGKEARQLPDPAKLTEQLRVAGPLFLDWFTSQLRAGTEQAHVVVKTLAGSMPHLEAVLPWLSQNNKTLFVNALADLPLTDCDPRLQTAEIVSALQNLAQLPPASRYIIEILLTSDGDNARSKFLSKPTQGKFGRIVGKMFKPR